MNRSDARGAGDNGAELQTMAQLIGDNVRVSDNVQVCGSQVFHGHHEFLMGKGPSSHPYANGHQRVHLYQVNNG
jgi:hypothetical protein